MCYTNSVLTKKNIRKYYSRKTILLSAMCNTVLTYNKDNVKYDMVSSVHYNKNYLLYFFKVIEMAI